MRGKRMERRNQVEQGTRQSLSQKVQDLVHVRDRQLAEAVNLVTFVVVDGDPNDSRLLGDDYRWARMWRGRVLDQACHEVCSWWQ